MKIAWATMMLFISSHVYWLSGDKYGLNADGASDMAPAPKHGKKRLHSSIALGIAMLVFIVWRKIRQQ